jgi:uncharacterized protein (TIGR02118 family)
MIKVFGPTNRNDRMSREDYAPYYTQQQTGIARRIPGMCKDYANVCLRAANGGEPAWDSVAEMYWRSTEDAERDFTSEQWNAARADHLNGIAGRLMWVAEETEFLDEQRDSVPDGAVKYLGFLNRKDGISREQFVDYWFEKHVPLALKTPGLRRYRASVSRGSFNGDSPNRGTIDASPFDGAVEMWFDSIEAFDASFSDTFWDRLRIDYYTNFAMGRMQVLVRENQVFDDTSG